LQTTPSTATTTAASTTTHPTGGGLGQTGSAHTQPVLDEANQNIPEPEGERGGAQQQQ